MISFLLASQNFIFTVSLVLMLAIAVLEGCATLLGAGFSEFLDSVLPELDVDVDLDLLGADSPPPLSRFLSWFRVGEVPALMLLVIFLTAFGLIGLFFQSIASRVTAHLLPGVMVAIPAFLVSMPIVRLGGGLLSKVMPKDETEAVSEKSFIGSVATIVLGAASKGKPAQAKLKDTFGQTHYIMVEPDDANDVFKKGTEVILVVQEGSVFRAIRNNSAALT